MTSSNPDSRIVGRMNSGRPRVQQTAGQTKLLNGLAVPNAICTSETMLWGRSALAMEEFSVHLHAQCPTVTASLSKHPALTKELKISPFSKVGLAAAASSLTSALHQRLQEPQTSLDLQYEPSSFQELNKYVIKPFLSRRDPHQLHRNFTVLAKSVAMTRNPLRLKTADL